MNGDFRGESEHAPSNAPPNTVQANGRPSHQPPLTGHPGIISNVTAALRILQTHNAGVLNQAISQLEAVHDIQNELVSARAAYSQVSSDLRKAVDQNLSQAAELLKSRDELHSQNVKLHAAREQLFVLEKQLESTGSQVAAHERQLAAVRAEKDKQIEGLTAALQVANTRIASLGRKLQSVAAAVETVETSESVALSGKAIGTSPFSLRDLDEWLSSSSKRLDEATAKAQQMAASLAEPVGIASCNVTEVPTGEPSALSEESKEGIARLVKTSFQTSKDEKQQIFSHLKSLRAEYSNILDVAQTSVSRNLVLERAFKIIQDLNVKITASVHGTPAEVDVEIKMDRERTEAGKVIRQANNRTPSIKSATTSPLISSCTSYPPTPSQSVFSFGSASPQRKRQRTSTDSATPEPLPRDDELYAFVRLIHTAYEIRSPQQGAKQLVCKACDGRHKTQPEFPATTFEYPLDQKIAIPSFANAEHTRIQIRPWVAHLQEVHRGLYAGFMQKFKNQTSSRRASIAPSN
ncbi:hypothetical protein RhiLY_04198 [Ceratobasidium sp. AG-Ba]|nr:hypothetical protein RhiLY_04198 [Ceratobasidium sp. AG-Ba]